MPHQLNPRSHTATAALTFEVTPGAREILILPAGEFAAADGSGRPAECAAWRLDAASAGRVIARAALRNSRMVVDYEHQTLRAEENGQPAPAAGWIDRASLAWREGLGLVAAVEWTEKAAAMIAAGEYKYHSPVFNYDQRTGEVLALRHLALTNDPGLDMPAVALRALNDLPTTEASMPELLKKLLAKLGLAETASEAEIEAAFDALQKKASDAEAKTAEVAALKSKAPDPAHYVAVATMHAMQQENTSLKTQLNQIEVDKVVTAALAAGQIAPVMKGWAEELGKSNLAALKSYVEKTPANPALAGTQTGGATPAGAGGTGTVALTAEQAEVAKALGLSVAQFAAGKLEV